jgi:hypothetical protein
VRYVGDISYSLYLWHWPVLVFGAYLLGHQPRPAETVTLLAIILAVSVPTYQLVENPIRHQHFPGLSGLRSLVLWPATLVIVLATSNWMGGFATHRFEAVHGSADAKLAPELVVNDAGPSGEGGTGTGQQVQLPHPDLDALINTALDVADRNGPIPFPLANFHKLRDDVWQTKFECYAHWEQSRARVCPLGDLDATRTVVLVGDSHAGMWIPPLDLLGRRDGFRLIPLIKLGCAPFDVVQQHGGDPMPSCPRFRAWALQQIGRVHPDVVLLAYRSLLGVVPPAGTTVDEAWLAGARSSLATLAEITARVEIISDITDLDFSPGDCLTALHSTMATCTQQSQTRSTTAGNAMVRDAAQGNARFIDVTELVCRHDRCPLVVDDVVTYRDPWHITVTWSTVIAHELGRRLRLQ